MSDNFIETPFGKIDCTFAIDPYEVWYPTSEVGLHWYSDIKDKRNKALEKARQLYPDQYYHKGLHTTKPGEFNGITIYLRDREPTEEELKLEELEGFPFRIKSLGDPFNTFIINEK